METKFNFKSQVCTDRFQSERLLALGLKKETADIVLLKEMVYDEENHCTRDGEGYLIRPIEYLEGEEHRGHIPAWSLHRLIEMMPKTIGRYFQYTSNDSCGYMDEDALNMNGGFDEGNIYDSIISCIEWLIKEGYFNKEYLEE